MTTPAQKTAAVVAIITALFAVGVAFLALRGGSGDAANAMREGQAASDEGPGEPFGQNQDVMPERMTLTGEYVECLPEHDNFSEDVCIPGIKTDDGRYYAINFMLMSQMMETPLVAGQRFRANGVVTPIEMLSAAQWQQSIATGIFSVTEMPQLL